MDKKYKLSNGDTRTVSPEEEEKFLTNNPGAELIVDDSGIPSETDLSQSNQVTKDDLNWITSTSGNLKDSDPLKFEELKNKLLGGANIDDGSPTGKFFNAKTNKIHTTDGNGNITSSEPVTTGEIQKFIDEVNELDNEEKTEEEKVNNYQSQETNYGSMYDEGAGPDEYKYTIIGEDGSETKEEISRDKLLYTITHPTEGVDFVEDILDGTVKLEIPHDPEIHEWINKKIQTNKYLKNTNLFPESFYDAEEIVLDDGRKLSTTPQWTDWTYKNVGIPEDEIGTLGYYLGGFSLKQSPYERWYTKTYPEHWSAKTMSGLQNITNTVTGEGEFVSLADQRGPQYTSIEVFKTNDNIIPTINPNAASVIRPEYQPLNYEKIWEEYKKKVNKDDRGVTPGVFSLQDAIDQGVQFDSGLDKYQYPSGSPETLNDLNDAIIESYKNFDIKRNEFDTYTVGGGDLVETVAPIIENQLNQQFQVKNNPRFIKVKDVSPINVMGPGLDVVEVTVGNLPPFRQVLNKNGLKGAPLDEGAIDAINFHVAQYLDPNLKGEFNKYVTELLYNNEELMNASQGLQESSQAQANFYNELDKIFGIKPHSTGRLIDKEFTRKYGDVWTTMSTNTHHVEQTGYFNFTDSFSGKTFKVPYHYFNKLREQLAGPESEVSFQKSIDYNVELNEKAGGPNVRVLKNGTLEETDDPNGFNGKRTFEMMDPKNNLQLFSPNDYLPKYVSLKEEYEENPTEENLEKLNEFVDKYNITDMVDDDGNWKYKPMWQDHPDSNVKDLLVKIGNDGKPIIQENGDYIVRPKNVSDNPEYIENLAINYPKEQLLDFALKSDARLQYLVSLAVNNTDLIYDNTTSGSNLFNQITGSQKEEDLMRILEGINIRGSLYQPERYFDPNNTLHHVPGDSPLALAINKELALYKAHMKAFVYNIDPIEQHQETMWKNALNTVSHAFVGRDIVGPGSYFRAGNTGDIYSTSTDINMMQNMYADFLNEMELITPDPENTPSNKKFMSRDWFQSVFYGHSQYRKLGNATSDITAPLAVLMSEIRTFNLGGYAFGGVKTATQISNFSKTMLHGVKKRILGRTISKSKWVNGTIDHFSGALAITAEWALAEKLHDTKNAHTLHRDAKTGKYTLNWEFPVSMYTGGMIWGKFVSPTFQKAMNKYHGRSTRGQSYMLMRDHMGKSFVKPKNPVSTAVFNKLVDKTGSAATAVMLLQFSSITEKFVKDVKAGNLKNYPWAPDHLKDPNSEEYKQWAQEWEDLNPFTPEGRMNTYGMFLTMTMLGGKGKHGNIFEVVRKGILSASRHTKRTKQQANDLGLKKEHGFEDGTYKEADIEGFGNAKIKGIESQQRKINAELRDGKISKTEANKKSKKLELEKKKIIDAVESLKERNLLIISQKNAMFEGTYDKWIKNRVTILNALRDPINAQTIQTIDELDPMDFEKFLAAEGKTVADAPMVTGMFYAMKGQMDLARKYFGKEKSKARTRYLEVVFEQQQLKHKIEKWQDNLNKNVLGASTKTIIDNNIKKAKEKIAELEKELKGDKDNPGIFAQFDAEYQSRVERELAIKKAWAIKLTKLEGTEVWNVAEVKRNKNGTIVEGSAEKAWKEMLKKENMTDTGGEAFISGDGLRIYINAERMNKYKTLSSATHELIHMVLWNHLMKRYKTKDGKGGYRVTDDGKKIIDALMKQLSENERKLIEDKIETVYKYEVEIKHDASGKNFIGYKYHKDGKKKGQKVEKNERDYYDEKITAFGDLVRSGKIKRNVALDQKVNNVFQGMVSKLFTKAYKYEMGKMNSTEAAKQIMNAVIEMQSPNQTRFARFWGAVGLTRRVKQIAKTGVGEKGQASVDGVGRESNQGRWIGGKTKRVESVWLDPVIVKDLGLSKNTEGIVRKNMALEAEVFERAKERGINFVTKEHVPVDVQNALVMNNLARVNALAKKAWEFGEGIEKDRVTFEDFQSGYQEQLIKLSRTWNPMVKQGGKIKEVPFGAYMNSLLPRRYGDVLKGEKSKIETKSMVTTEGKTREFEDVYDMTGDISLNTKKPQYSKLRQDLKLTKETMGVISQAVIKTFGTKLPEITTKDFKAELEKRFRTELKKPIQDLIGSRENYDKFLIEHFKSVFEALPKETLIQMERNVKPENRILTTSERITKPTEVDRLISEGLLPKDVSRTSGPQLHTKNSYPGTERVLAFFRGLNMENVLGYKVGASTLGTRKDKLAMEMGVELAFDATMEVIQRPDVAKKRSDILELQELEQLSNEAVIIAKQIDRSPTGRFSNNSNWDIKFENAGKRLNMSKADVKWALENLKPEQLKYDLPEIGAVLDAYARTKGTPAEINNKGYLDIIRKDPLLNVIFEKHGNFHRYRTTKGGKEVYNKTFMKKHFENYVKEILKFIPENVLAREGTYKDGKLKGGHLIPGHQRFFANGLLKVGSGRSPNGGWSLEAQHAVKGEYIEAVSGRHKDVKPGEFLTSHTEKLFNEYSKLKEKHGEIDLFESTVKTKEGANKLFEDIQKDNTTTQMQKAGKADRLYKAGSQKVNKAFTKAYLSSIQDYVNYKTDMAKPKEKEATREEALMHIIVDMYANSNFTKGLRALAPGVGLYLPPGKAALTGKVKGEHGKDRARFDASVTSSLMRGDILKDFNSLWYGYEQIRLPVELGNKLDNLGGRNNPQGAFRYMFEPSIGKNIYLPGEGKFLNDVLTEKVSIEAAKVLSDSKVGHRNIRLAEVIAQSQRNSISGKVRGASVFDFDDTMAFTKSGVRTRVPNPSGTPKPGRKVIFMAGGAGSGKSNVIKKLGLEKDGFKIVNSDISLEWLKKNHGLPESMKDLTKEQRSMLGKLGHQARKIAKGKMMKYQGSAEGVVVDGTGGSIKVMEKLVTEFKDKGYDVSMMFVETTLKTAMNRNKARKERSLLDIIVKKNHEAVQGNKPGFKTLFGDRFMEVKTDKLTMESPMPKELVLKMKDFVNSYEKLRLDAAEFAARGKEISERNGEFDFSEFNKVVEGTEGPYLKNAIEKAKKYGTKDLFVLTARPAESAGPIREFLRSQGLNIPLENITGLGNSTGLAKAKWMLEKASKGYNDFFFVDDAIQNVEAVKKALGQIDVKSKVIQAKGRFSNSMNLEFNNILERSSKGKIESGRDISLAEARALGRGKGRFDYFVPPSAEDFRGLMYKLLGKGEQGNADMRFFKKSLFDPFAEGIRDLTITKQRMVEEYKELKKVSKNIKLNKKIEGTAFNVDAAVRMYLWDKAGHVIPDISPQLVRQLSDYVKNRPELLTYAETLSSLSRSSNIYREPGKHWMVENIASDLNQLVRGETRQKFLQEWIDNKNIIFSKENLNKLEAVHGKWYREALENMLYRMETGTNRISGKDGVSKMWYDWINGSVGATMFWNTRSAVLQTISMVNFTNMAENSVYHQAKAFANQPQFWKDFAFIMNSPMLKQRRGGLEIDVSASELTNMFEKSGKNPKAILRYFLEKGFTPTRIADSFAIAMGGSGFYRNRLNMYLKRGLSESKAKEKAWLDFQEIAERTQQSSRPDLISQQQAGPLGRIILAWQNTPMQMTRLMKKKLSDVTNRRKNEGQTQFQSDMSNLSGILYYGAMQNLWFMTLQSGLAWIMFGSDMEDKIEQKEIQVLNGAFDTLLRGTGVYGAAASTLKNTILRYLKEKEKPKWKRDQAYTIIEALNLSPPIGSKVRKAYSAIKTWEYNEGVGKELGFRVENPNFHAYANLIEAATNVPLARLINKANNLEEAITGNHETWQRIAMISGWSKWNVGVKDEELEEAKGVAKEKRQEKQKIETEKKKEEKKIEKEKLKEEEKKKEEQEKKEKGIKVVRCSGRNSSGKRCGLTTETAEKKWKCFHHGSFKDGGDRDGDGIKEYQCTGRTKSGNRCKNKGEYTGKKKRCYAH